MGRTFPSYLLTRNRRHFLRCRVPLDLVSRLGRDELVRALGTGNAGLARLITASLALRLDRLWTMMRDTPELTEPELRRLADNWLRREIEREWRLLETGEFARRALPDNASPAEERFQTAQWFAQDATHTELALLGMPREDAWRVMDDVAGELLAKAGHGQRTGSRERAQLSMMLLDRRIDLQESKRAWVDGNPGHNPPQLRRPEAVEPAQSPSEAPAGTDTRTLKEAIDLFIANMRQRGAKEKHIKDALVDFRVIQDAFGAERRVGTIGASDAGRLWEALRALPPKFRERPELAGLDLFGKAAKAREIGLPPIHFRTANSYLARWRGLFEQEIAGGQIATNPFAGKRAVPEGRVVKQERTFTQDELEILFGSPLFQGAQSDRFPYGPGSHLVGDWRFWAPLVALMSGARIGEIAQLRPRDIRQVGSFIVIDINEEDGKTLKNDGTARRIPIHSRLVELGFLDLARTRLAAGHVLLLPNMPRPVLDHPGTQASKWMSERFLPRLGLKTRVGLGFHSFRHTLKTLLRSAEVADSISNEICGHDKRTSGVSAGYGKVPLDGMAAAIERLRLPDAVLRLQPRPVWSALLPRRHLSSFSLGSAPGRNRPPARKTAPVRSHPGCLVSV